LERHPTIIEAAHVAMVRAGEASGKLDTVLRAIVEDRVQRQLMAERVTAAIRYPLFSRRIGGRDSPVLPDVRRAAV
jgi:general secretion pathway protein F